MDCGPSCLRIVAAYYGRRYSVAAAARTLSHHARSGVSLLGISDAAGGIGFRTAGVKLTWRQLREEVTLPLHRALEPTPLRRGLQDRTVARRMARPCLRPASGLLCSTEEQFTPVVPGRRRRPLRTRAAACVPARPGRASPCCGQAGFYERGATKTAAWVSGLAAAQATSAPTGLPCCNSPAGVGGGFEPYSPLPHTVGR